MGWDRATNHHGQFGRAIRHHQLLDAWGSRGGQQIRVFLIDRTTAYNTQNYFVYPQANTWTKVEIPVASDKQGGTFHLEFDGQDVTGPIQVPDTGGWTTLQTISKNGVPLKAGQQTMKLLLDTEGPSGSIGDIDFFEFRLQK